ncbi:MAG TPA: hypothetical protein VFC02_27590 [Anaerolineales bacterium]|nr:hypothetical protein [Anaerolineales bacterium]
MELYYPLRHQRRMRLVFNLLDAVRTKTCTHEDCESILCKYRSLKSPYLWHPWENRYPMFSSDFHQRIMCPVWLGVEYIIEKYGEDKLKYCSDQVD